MVSVALLLLAACALSYYLVFVRNTFPAGGVRSVAVLPFANETNNPDVEYLSDGISDSLINRLSLLPGVKVIARSSSFVYKGKEAQSQEVANNLGVEAIVTGRVTQYGENLLINVELVDGRDRTQIWGETYNRKAESLLSIQSEISQMILEKLRLRLNTAQHKQFAKDRTVKPQAYELFLNGRFYDNKGGTENRKKAIDYYLNAIAVDPAYALAYAELSRSYNGLVNDNVLDPKAFLPKAEEAAIKAVELDDDLAEAHLATAKVKQNGWDWAAAEQEFLRAIELNPNLAIAHVNYVYFLIIQGRYDPAIAAAQRAKELDPLSRQVNEVIVYGLILQGQNDRALEAVNKMVQLDPLNAEVHTLLGQIYAAKGQYREALTAYQQAIKLGDDSPDAQIYLGLAYRDVGEPEKTRSILHRLETRTE
ncbi:MAG: tetratricopeptide repeat protein, partial [Pyrinomonadaceae bacterium]